MAYRLVCSGRVFSIWILAMFLCFSLGRVEAQTPPERLLLKDYNPKSIYKVPVTTIEKAKYPVIDMHLPLEPSWSWPR